MRGSWLRVWELALLGLRVEGVGSINATMQLLWVSLPALQTLANYGPVEGFRHPAISMFERTGLKVEALAAPGSLRGSIIMNKGTPT